MSATLVTLSGNDLFQSGGGSDHLISITGVDDIIGESGLAIYNSVSVRLNETIQYFLTFDDVIKAIHFGKGVGSVLAEGTMFSTCSGDVPGMTKFSKAFSNLRGTVTKAVIGGMALDIMVTDAQVQIIGDPDTMAMFSFNFAILDHSL